MKKLLLAALLLTPTLALAQPLPPQIPQQPPQNVDTYTACYLAGLAYSEGATVTGANGQIFLCLRPAGVTNTQQRPMIWAPVSGNPASGNRQR